MENDSDINEHENVELYNVKTTTWNSHRMFKINVKRAHHIESAFFRAFVVLCKDTSQVRFYKLNVHV